MLRAWQQQQCLLTVHRLCRVKCVSDVVLSYCVVKGIAPEGNVQISLSGSKSNVINIVFLLMLLLWCLMVKRQISSTVALLYSVFPAMHVHVERCDWLKSVKATSSGQFGYLSAGRSRLTSLLWCHMLKLPPMLPWHGPFLTVQNYPTLKYKGQRPWSLPTPLNTWAPAHDHHLPFYFCPLNKTET